MYHLGRLIDLVVLRHVPKLCGLVILLLIVLKITGDVGRVSFFGGVALTYVAAFVSGLRDGSSRQQAVSSTAEIRGVEISFRGVWLPPWRASAPAL